MRFADIPWHEDAKQRLRNMIQTNRLPHALLISGPEGVGKMMMARAAAQYIHCENPTPDGDSCGTCPACLQHSTQNHIDTHYIFPLVKGKSSSPLCDDYMAEWRKFLLQTPYMDFKEWMNELDSPNSQPMIFVGESDSLIHKLNFTSHKARYKVVILWLPERLMEQTANKLLKLIEEPHDDVKFILVSNNDKAILPTIYSRTQRIELKRLPDHIISAHLAETYGIDPADANALAHSAEGSMNRALASVGMSKENQEFLNLFMLLMREAYQRDIKGLKDWATEISAMGREQELRFLSYCGRLIRENFIYNIGRPDLNYLNKSEAAFSKNFARFVNERNVQQIMEEINQACTDIAGNANAKIVLFDFAVRMILLLKA
ncbi:AAA family ATPase [uncultured Muribaculum sp.]|uniref:DNA polymerase III subunit n=1 Tax=uncultured Muribaculum sp. TaxID=1918613 RepID=UPI0025A935A8|nr:AAA family ATPase [uncultured Muribaculum sp.]